MGGHALLTDASPSLLAPHLGVAMQCHPRGDLWLHAGPGVSYRWAL